MGKLWTSFFFLSGVTVGSVMTIAATLYRAHLKSLKDDEEDNDDRNQRSFLARSLRSNPLGGSISRSLGALDVDGINLEGEFLNALVKRMWPNIDAALSKTIQETIEPSFASLPGPLKSLHFEKFDLGLVPIDLINFEITGNGSNTAIKVNFDVVWDGEAKIKLASDYGKLGVKSIKFLGRMVFLLKPLINEMPIMGAIQVSFVNKPELEMDFTGFANLVEYGGFYDTFKGIILDAFSVVTLPNRLVVRLDDMATEEYFETVYTPPLGIARVTLCKGRGFEVEKQFLRGNDIPDVYCNLELGGQQWTSSIIKDNLEPEWNEQCDFLLIDLDQFIDVHAWDSDGGPLDPDDDLGCSIFRAGELIFQARGDPHEKELLESKSKKGTSAFITMKSSLIEFVDDLSSLEQAKGTKAGDPTSNLACGLLTIFVYRVLKLSVPKTEAKSYVQITFRSSSADAEDDKKKEKKNLIEFVTETVAYKEREGGMDPLDPIYNFTADIPITKEMVAAGDYDIVMTLINNKQPLGEISVSLDSLLLSENGTISDKGRIGTENTFLCYQAIVKGISEAPVDASVLTEDQINAMPTPTVRGATTFSPSKSRGKKNEVKRYLKVTVVKGENFGILKKRFGKADIPDLYTKLKFGSERLKTQIIKDNCNPVWDYTKEFKIGKKTDSELNAEGISIEVFDNNKTSNDVAIGAAGVKVGDILTAKDKTLKIPILQKGKKTEQTITLACEIVEH